MDEIWFRHFHPAEDESHTVESCFRFELLKNDIKTLIFSNSNISYMHWAHALKMHYAILEGKFKIRV